MSKSLTLCQRNKELPSIALAGFSFHVVSGLKSACFTRESPWKKDPKLKGSCAKGKTFERTIYRRLCAVLNPADIHYGEWIRFEDSTGKHYAQPDIFIVGEKRIWLIEVKLSQTPNAFAQMRLLYKPLLEKLFPEKDIVIVQVCKNLRYKPKVSITRLRDALCPSVDYTYHCLGEVFNV